MKKFLMIFVIALIVPMAFFLTACGGNPCNDSCNKHSGANADNCHCHGSCGTSGCKCHGSH